MLRNYLLLVFWLLAGPAAAQYGSPEISPASSSAAAAPVGRLPPTSFRGGSYQVLGQGWQRGKLLYDARTMRARCA